MVERIWRARALVALAVAMAGLAILAQACGGGSAEVAATPTAKPLPTLTPEGGTPTARSSFGAPGQGAFVGGASEEFAAFLGISLEQLQTELGAEGATPGSVAEAHGRTRDELKTFFTEQMQANLSDAVAAGTMSQEDADSMLTDLSSRIDDIIDGNAPFGRPGQAPAGP
jgi:hypothetical protein